MYFLKNWYSPRKTDWVAARAGRKHGERAIDPIPDLVIVSRLNQEAPYDPLNVEHHKELEERSKEHPKLAEWTASYHAADKSLTKYANRWFLRSAFFTLLLVEFFGIETLLDGQGMDEPHKTIVSLAGACIFFYLTYLAAKGVRS